MAASHLAQNSASTSSRVETHYSRHYSRLSFAPIGALFPGVGHLASLGAPTRRHPYKKAVVVHSELISLYLNEQQWPGSALDASSTWSRALASWRYASRCVVVAVGSSTLATMGMFLISCYAGGGIQS